MDQYLNQALEDITRHGYKVIETSKPHRFVRGTAKKDGQIYFFKVSPPEPELIERLQKQNSFEQFMYSHIQSSPPLPFQTPKPIQSNFTKSSNWIITEFFPGELLASWTPKREPRELIKWLNKISDSLLFFDSLDTTNIHLLNDHPHQDTANERMTKFMSKWSEKPLKQNLLTEKELARVIKIMEDSPPLPTRLQHGDFVPWHMIDLGEKFGIIDNEGASINKPRFYDAAYFYHRVFTKLCEPQIARLFLQIFIQKSGFSKKEIATSFLPMLGPRAVGGLFDYTNSEHLNDTKKSALSLHRQFLQLVLKQELSALL
ncbi:hypothetical protein A3A14_01435 [Candidatus Daviesbacteria bacterium RIFCSPLOWO2_01_FULL_43_38]|uniref:Aminoglycoside phosphotransferase domain-containing protein n=2 Tax=Candidatus Daviesiibacteriota TaxID=1752718 RepID=A0A1F5K7H1_9BACT|nr:MAG: hypothetical protein UV41_C0010G0017 [Candidatus Daviesbacteria bacterium GW2011_GWA2_42_7]OGE18961.1 MAG: hypothetical protein A2874_02280 [Candidatus Daviesbacteria bacterium RIFCSPHIGHO2_01_FULL_43_17]OGE36893.1 MAG: hypothetical protein A3E45_03560 [Candidatus Daviesbacteria bacterium RIFCSPHIGHO2_12_FULL_43_11]OGE63320.1 MAG: hypothetical protein A3A14_01435 [Candidatus Daviesbacteria bacterium RIFCSPLOWO2_01_FULL_43_38]OGE70864.1 MAG: hypothetical protein A3J21_00055 [Candidatus D